MHRHAFRYTVSQDISICGEKCLLLHVVFMCLAHLNND